MAMRPAFPRPAFDWPEKPKKRRYVCEPQEGMTLRQFYKAQLVAGLASELVEAENPEGRQLVRDIGRVADLLIREDERFEERHASA